MGPRYAGEPRLVAQEPADQTVYCVHKFALKIPLYGTKNLDFRDFFTKIWEIVFVKSQSQNLSRRLKSRKSRMDFISFLQLSHNLLNFFVNCWTAKNPLIRGLLHRGLNVNKKEWIGTSMGLNL